MQPENPFAENPYAPPSPIGSIPPFAYKPQNLEPVSGWLRFANMFLDGIATNILSSGCGFVIGLLYAFSRANPATPLAPDEDIQLRIVGMIVGLFVVILYYIVTESLWQRSLAKFVTGTRVVSDNGDKPTFGQIVGRTFARMIPFEAFSFLSSNPVGWHDSLSGTRVVKAN